MSSILTSVVYPRGRVKKKERRPSQCFAPVAIAMRMDQTLACWVCWHMSSGFWHWGLDHSCLCSREDKEMLFTNIESLNSF